MMSGNKRQEIFKIFRSLGYTLKGFFGCFLELFGSLVPYIEITSHSNRRLSVLNIGFSTLISCFGGVFVAG